MMFSGLPPTAMMTTVGIVPQNMGVPHRAAMSASVNGARGPPPPMGPPGVATAGGFHQAHNNGGAHTAPSFEQLAAATTAGMPPGRNVLAMTHTLTAQLQQTEVVSLFVPDLAVGAIIGSKGGHIRNMIKYSGANVKIAPASVPGTAAAGNDSSEGGQQQQEPQQGQAEGASNNDALDAISFGMKLDTSERKVTIVGK